jgi:hypothetical protein
MQGQEEPQVQVLEPQVPKPQILELLTRPPLCWDAPL